MACSALYPSRVASTIPGLFDFGIVFPLVSSVNVTAMVGSLSHAQDVVNRSLAIPDGILFSLDEHIKNSLE